MTTDEQLKLPRGVRIFAEDARPMPFACQWRADGKRKTKFFKTEKHRDAFAFSLAKGVEHVGVAAYQLNPSEAHEWRAFRAQLGEDVQLGEVLTCWLKHGNRKAVPTVDEAVIDYLATKEAEEIAGSTLLHYRGVYARISEGFKGQRVDAVTREDLAAWLGKLNMAPYSVRTHLIRAKGLFSWLKINRKINESPCDGLKPPRIVQDDVAILTVEQGRDLFEKNTDRPREVLGRLALEAFAGLRYSSASQVVPADVMFAEKGISLPAAKLKTRRRQFIDGLPDNLWEWLEWSDVASWSISPRNYMRLKSACMDRAKISVHNGLRHSFATYHVAAHKDISRTAVVLCHSSPKMLWSHYKGKATEADGKAWFEIVPK